MENHLILRPSIDKANEYLLYDKFLSCDLGFSQRGYECCGIPFASPSKKTKKRFNWRVVKRELWPQSCINREYLEDSRVMR